MTRSHRSAFVALTVSVGLLLAACATSGDGAGGELAITTQDRAFDPDVLTAPGGQQAILTITNKDSVTHSFTLDDGGVSRDIPAGQTAQVTVPFPPTGSAGFHCRFHATMTGTLRAG